MKSKTTSTKTDNKSKCNQSKKEPASQKIADKKTTDKKSTQSSTNNNSINSVNSNDDKKDKIKIDFSKILTPSLITTNEKVDFYLYLELMNNIDKKDDIKTLAICRLILAQDKNNTKVKELHDIIYESVKDNYYKTGELRPENEPEMDKHMKLNKDGEYEYEESEKDEEDEKE